MKVILFLLILSFVSCQSQRPKMIGIKSGELHSCPDSPNCVVSFNKEDKDHFIDPIKYQESKESVLARFKKYLAMRKDVTLVTDNGDYLHYQFKSKFFGFIDDVEFLLKDDGLIHMRSASRVGYSDLGKNRSRLEEIRFKFYQNEF